MSKDSFALPPNKIWYCYYSDHPLYRSAPEYLGVTRRQTQRFVADGKLGGVRLGAMTLFSQEQLDQFIASR